MNSSSINNYYSSKVASVLSGGLQRTGISPQKPGAQPSPFTQMLSALQQLQQSNPAGGYQQVTQQIAANLQTAAQTAQSNGNSAAAKQFTQLSKDFANASASGQLPNVQDLAQAVGGSGTSSAGGGHHHFLSALSSLIGFR
jgi:hypothetical protein